MFIFHTYYTYINIIYRVFIKYCVFLSNVVIFLNSASSAAALVFYLPFSGPSMKSSVHNERHQSPEYILKFSKKHNIWHPVFAVQKVTSQRVTWHSHCVVAVDWGNKHNFYRTTCSNLPSTSTYPLINPRPLPPPEFSSSVDPSIDFWDKDSTYK